MTEKPKKGMDEHILPVSSNLLAICFAAVALMVAGHVTENTLIDNCTALAALFFLAASILSYSSIRSVKRPNLYEKLADWIFLAGLLFLTIVTVGLVLGLIT